MRWVSYGSGSCWIFQRCSNCSTSLREGISVSHRAVASASLWPRLTLRAIACCNSAVAQLFATLLAPPGTLRVPESSDGDEDGSAGAGGAGRDKSGDDGGGKVGDDGYGLRPVGTPRAEILPLDGVPRMLPGHCGLAAPPNFRDYQFQYTCCRILCMEPFGGNVVTFMCASTAAYAASWDALLGALRDTSAPLDPIIATYLCQVLKQFAARDFEQLCSKFNDDSLIAGLVFHLGHAPFVDFLLEFLQPSLSPAATGFASSLLAQMLRRLRSFPGSDYDENMVANIALLLCHVGDSADARNDATILGYLVGRIVKDADIAADLTASAVNELSCLPKPPVNVASILPVLTTFVSLLECGCCLGCHADEIMRHRGSATLCPLLLGLVRRAPVLGAAISKQNRTLPLHYTQVVDLWHALLRVECGALDQVFCDSGAMRACVDLLFYPRTHGMLVSRVLDLVETVLGREGGGRESTTYDVLQVRLIRDCGLAKRLAAFFAPANESLDDDDIDHSFDGRSSFASSVGGIGEDSSLFPMTPPLNSRSRGGSAGIRSGSAGKRALPGVVADRVRRADSRGGSTAGRVGSAGFSRRESTGGGAAASDAAAGGANAVDAKAEPPTLDTDGKAAERTPAVVPPSPGRRTALGSRGEKRRLSSTGASLQLALPVIDPSERVPPGAASPPRPGSPRPGSPRPGSGAGTVRPGSGRSTSGRPRSRPASTTGRRPPSRTAGGSLRSVSPHASSPRGASPRGGSPRAGSPRAGSLRAGSPRVVSPRGASPPRPMSGGSPMLSFSLRPTTGRSQTPAPVVSKQRARDRNMSSFLVCLANAITQSPISELLEADSEWVAFVEGPLRVINSIWGDSVVPDGDSSAYESRGSDGYNLWEVEDDDDDAVSGSGSDEDNRRSSSSGRNGGAAGNRANGGRSSSPEELDIGPPARTSPVVHSSTVSPAGTPSSSAGAPSIVVRRSASGRRTSSGGGMSVVSEGRASVGGSASEEKHFGQSSPRVAEEAATPLGGSSVGGTVVRRRSRGLGLNVDLASPSSSGSGSSGEAKLGLDSPSPSRTGAASDTRGRTGDDSKPMAARSVLSSSQVLPGSGQPKYAHALPRSPVGSGDVIIDSDDDSGSSSDRSFDPDDMLARNSSSSSEDSDDDVDDALADVELSSSKLDDSEPKLRRVANDDDEIPDEASDEEIIIEEVSEGKAEALEPGRRHSGASSSSGGSSGGRRLGRGNGAAAAAAPRRASQSRGTSRAVRQARGSDSKSEGGSVDDPDALEVPESLGRPAVSAAGADLLLSEAQTVDSPDPSLKVRGRERGAAGAGAAEVEEEVVDEDDGGDSVEEEEVRPARRSGGSTDVRSPAISVGDEVVEEVLG